MAWTQTQLDALEAAIAQGTTKVKYSDKEVTYRSLDEMMQIRDKIREDLGITSGRNKRIFSEHSRGY